MAGQRPPQTGVHGIAARPPAPATPALQSAPPRPPPPSLAPGGGQQGGDAAVSYAVQCSRSAAGAASPASVEAAGAAGVYAAPAAAHVPGRSAVSAGTCVSAISAFLCAALRSDGRFVPNATKCSFGPAVKCDDSKCRYQEQAEEEKECRLF
jgi:hypothetical protein